MDSEMNPEGQVYPSCPPEWQTKIVWKNIGNRSKELCTTPSDLKARLQHWDRARTGRGEATCNRNERRKRRTSGKPDYIVLKPAVEWPLARACRRKGSVS